MEDFRKSKGGHREEHADRAGEQSGTAVQTSNDEQQGHANVQDQQNYSYDEYDAYSPWG